MSTPLSKEEAFARLGSITREMHEALSVLGANQLHNIGEEIPNARDRLAYVGKMTEDAANKVLNWSKKPNPLAMTWRNAATNWVLRSRAWRRARTTAMRKPRAS